MAKKPMMPAFMMDKKAKGEAKEGSKKPMKMGAKAMKAMKSKKGY